MKHFLVVFDRSTGRLLSLEEPSNRGTAMSARFRAERMHKANKDIEVVVLGAESKQALQRTHSRYFGDLKSLADQGAQRVSDGRTTTASC